MYFITYQYREHECLTWQEVVQTYTGYLKAERIRAERNPNTRLDYPMVTGDGRDDECDGLTDEQREELEDIFCDTIRSNQ